MHISSTTNMHHCLWPAISLPLSIKFITYETLTG
jgi:hypothetical protein